MLKISVVMAVYNRKKLIQGALDSALSQSYGAIEIIVVDGGSSDGTQEIIKKNCAQLGKFISEEDDGIYDALNKGIQNSTGDVVGFLHADDIFEDDDVLSRVADAFKDPNVEAVYGDLVYVSFDDVSRVIRYWRAGIYNAKSFTRGWMPPHPTFYVRRSVYERFGRFDTSYRIAADYDIMLRFLAVHKIHAQYIPTIFVRMRVGGVSNSSLLMVLQKSFEDIRVLRKNKIGGLWTLIQKNLRKISQFWVH